MSFKAVIVATATLFGTTLATLTAAQAQSWPTRPVKFIVPFGPGAGAAIGGSGANRW